MINKIPLAVPHLEGNELAYLQEVLDSNWIAPVGKMLDAFEQSVCDFTGAKYALATNSGTSAIHLGLRLLGVGEGDYVICPTLTFIATANPILYLGAKPIFVDSDERGNISPAHLEKALAYCTQTGKTVRAVIVVHLYGEPAQMNAILEITARYNLPILEDAAEALGGFYAGKALGTLGTVGVFSFNGNKIITTSGGGMLLLPTAEMREKALFWATQAKDQAPHYQHSEMGYNYRLSNVLAGLGMAQMEVLPARVERKKEIFKKWVEGTKGKQMQFLNSFTHSLTHSFTYPNYWLTVALFESYEVREQARLALGEAGIESRPVWKPLHLQPVFAQDLYFGEEIAKDLFERGLCLPSGTSLTDEDLEMCLGHLQKTLDSL